LDGSSELVKHRHATILIIAFAALGVACLDLSAPKGPASISPIQLPANFVVRGDTMRNEAGTPAPPVINQFDIQGQLIGGTSPQFFILDSVPAAHFDPTTGVLVGDHLGTVTILGQVGGVPGIAPLQTPTVIVPVTVLPTNIDQGTGALDTIKAPLTQDTTLALTIGQGASSMPVIVRGVGDTGVQGVVVHYQITRTLASNNAARQAVYITGPGGKLTNTDTTTAPLGAASKNQINVKASLLADVAIATGQKVDSVIVQATASYRGVQLLGSPVTFVFHVVGVIGSP
jgi:hypothetical protein